MTSYELRPSGLPRFGQRVALHVLRLFGWRLRYKMLPGPHGVAIVYPHTSNWDFVIGLLAKWALGLPLSWLAKEALFEGWCGKTFGPLLRAWGGMPVERHAASGATQMLATRMRQSSWCWVALAPEGTRTYRPHWRSGFYHLAVTAKVPLLLVYLDYPNKEIGAINSMRLCGDPELDMPAIAAVYKGHLGLHPELAAPIVLAPRSGDTGKQA